ncbi:Hypothetical protein POVN_LOCUS186 [uncultured virus]|nr:Hypothetical protein POVN_LOCUS186 [uncultured virus]
MSIDALIALGKRLEELKGKHDAEEAKSLLDWATKGGLKSLETNLIASLAMMTGLTIKGTTQNPMVKGAVFMDMEIVPPQAHPKAPVAAPQQTLPKKEEHKLHRVALTVDRGDQRSVLMLVLYTEHAAIHEALTTLAGTWFKEDVEGFLGDLAGLLAISPKELTIQYRCREENTVQGYMGKDEELRTMKQGLYYYHVVYAMHAVTVEYVNARTEVEAKAVVELTRVTTVEEATALCAAKTHRYVKNLFYAKRGWATEDAELLNPEEGAALTQMDSSEARLVVYFNA